VLKRALAKIPDISPEERRVLENMTKTLVRKLLRDPILRLNAAAGTEREQFYREALAALFGLDEINEEAESGSETDHRHPGQ